MPYSTSWRSILILFSHLRLGLPSGRLPSGLPTKSLYASIFSSTRATCPAYLILLDLITRIIFGDEYRSLSPLLCILLQSPAFSSLLGPNILHSTQFSNTLRLCSSLSVRDPVSHPYRTTGKIIVLYTLYVLHCLYIFLLTLSYCHTSVTPSWKATFGRLPHGIFSILAATLYIW
jgi:hypothetical protein